MPSQDPTSPADGAASVDGNSRRRLQTRAALVRAAKELLGEGQLDPSIQTITDRAGVGFGSFFNHFASKDELFAAAAESAFKDVDALLSSVTADVEDPLERVAVGMRIFGRLPEIDEHAARLIAFLPVDTFGVDSGYGLGFESDVLQSKERGRIPWRPERSNLLQTFVWGAFKHLSMLRVVGTDHPVEWVDDFTEVALCTLGVDPDEARRLAHLPLPDVPPS